VNDTNVLVVHQPHLLPWPGYFNKLAAADIFVVQDNVQFRRRYFQNRTKITIGDECRWLTVPVHATRHSRVREVRLVTGWRHNFLETIRHAYHRTEHFDALFPTLESAISCSCNSLLDLNLKLLKVCFDLLDISPDVRLASEFPELTSASETLANIAETVNASHYLFGEGGGLAYHGKAIFQSRGIATVVQDFRKPFQEAALTSEATFNLSIIDWLFKLGTQETQRLVKDLWQPDLQGRTRDRWFAGLARLVERR